MESLSSGQAPSAWRRTQPAKATSPPCVRRQATELQLRPGGDAVYNRDHPLDADLVVVDEASMLDVLPANTLVGCLPQRATQPHLPAGPA
jgi:ATP-dependent exoDNAse (exonuclease V) alpha subunit